MEVKLSCENGEISDGQRRKVAYGSVSPFAVLQSQKNAEIEFSNMPMISSSQFNWYALLECHYCNFSVI